MDKKHIAFIAIAGTLIIVEAALFLAGRRIKATPATVSVTPADSATQDATTTVPEGWQVYHNDAYGFGFAYPPDWSVATVSDDHETLTLGLNAPGIKGDSVAWVDVAPGDDIDSPINADIKRYAKSQMSYEETKYQLDDAAGRLMHYSTDGQDPESARWVYVKRGPDIYKIGITVDVSPFDEEFDQLLTTFVFLTKAKETPVKKDPKCDYRPAPFGGCETIYFDGSRCVIINEGQCQPNAYQVFQTLDDCRKLCE